jgi:hypothetical protein
VVLRGKVMDDAEYTIKLKNAEKEIIIRALCKLKQEFEDNKRWVGIENSRHKEMIDLLDGSKDNKLAKKRLKHEKDCFEVNERAIKSYDMFIDGTNLLINKYRNLK